MGGINTPIAGVGIFRTGLLTEQRGDPTLSENSMLTSRLHSARPDARRDSRLRTVAPWWPSPQNDSFRAVAIVRYVTILFAPCVAMAVFSSFTSN